MKVIMSLKNRITSLEKELQSKNDKINKYKTKYKHYKYLNQNKWVTKLDNDLITKEIELKSSTDNTRPIKVNKDPYDR